MLKALLLLSLFALVFSSCQSSHKDTPPPNVLFIAVDDLRPELGCYDHPVIQSPSLDKLAENGALFTRVYCNIPVCGASRASLLTGTRPTKTRFLQYYTRIDKEQGEVPTLPEYFRQKGYYTVANGKIAHHAFNDAVGSWDEEWQANTLSGWQDYAGEENVALWKDGKSVPYEALDVPDSAYRDGKIALKALRDLQRLKEKDQPFFLALGFLKPHLPFNAPKKYWDLYPDASIKLPDNNYQPHNAPRQAMHKWGELRNYFGIPKEGPLSDEMARKLIHGYYASVSSTDAQIGKVLEGLEDLGLAENTIVIVWGDHGYNLREHGLWCKHCNFNNSLHAPLLVAAPNKPRGVKIDAITEYVDIYPSLCELAGLELPPHLQGSSFVELLDNPEGESDGIAISQWFDGLTIIKDNYFYTEWRNQNDSVYARMLYDHSIDPDENNNVAELPENKEITEELSQLLEMNRGSEYLTTPEYTYSAKER